MNFGSVYQPPISPPNTVVPQQPDQGGGTDDLSVPLISIGTLTGRAHVFKISQPPGPGAGGGGSFTAATQPVGNPLAIQVVSTLDTWPGSALLRRSR